MKTAVSLKLMIMPAIIYSTWWLTSTIIAQPPKAVAAATELGGKVAIRHIPASVAFGPMGLNPRIASLHQLEELTVEVQGTFALVHASVHMMSRERSLSHLWRLKVTDMTTGAVVSDVPYIKQRFQMDPSGTMQPTFNEVMALPSGKYEVLLTLYRIPNGVAIAELLNSKSKDMAGAMLINVPKIIEIL